MIVVQPISSVMTLGGAGFLLVDAIPDSARIGRSESPWLELDAYVSREPLHLLGSDYELVLGFANKRSGTTNRTI
jgi:hypothetical protein